MPSTTDPLDALLAIRDGNLVARWNYVDAVGSPLNAPAGIGNAVTLSYSFLGAAPGYFPTTGFAAFSGAARSATGDVLGMISSMIGVGFREMAGVGTLTFGMNSQDGSAGFAYYPGFNTTYSGNTITAVTALDRAGDVWLNSNIAWTTADFAPGGSGFGTLVHEIGHALGLKHPFEAGTKGFTLDPAFDNKAWTVMSYTEHPNGLFRTVTDNGGGSYSWRYDHVEPETLMPYDIAALQYLYGTNTSHRTGNDTYTFDPARPFIRTLWDSGGTDTVSVANFSRSCVIDLRDGHFSSIRIPSDPLPPGQAETRTGIYDGTDNLAIAFGVTLENATGGAGNDRLTGNRVANVLDGGAGNDTMAGGDGSDTYRVGQAGDVVSESNASASSGGTDLVCSSLTSYTLGTNVENGRVMLGGTASLTGNSLNNVLFAGAGNNLLNGSSGTDTADYRHAGAAVTVSLALTGAQATGGSGSDTLQSIERLMGSAYADKLSGNSAANQLNGGAGADTLTGGDGNDTYTIDNTGDRISETNAGSSGGVDTLISSLASTTLGANIENGRISSTGAASLTGNGLANVLTAGAGNNTLNGSSGTDTADYSTAASAVTLSLALAGAQATGGSGSDTLVSIEDLAGSAFNDKLTGSSAVNVLRGAAGADTLSGGAGADTFVISSLSGSDTITDFASTSDKLLVSQAGVRVGDGDALLEGARTLAGPGGFAASAELVVLSANITGSLSAGSAAAAIGSATGGYTAGARVLFMVDNGSSSALYLFTSAGADALVSSSELALLATLTGTPATGTADLLFGA